MSCEVCFNRSDHTRCHRGQVVPAYQKTDNLPVSSSRVRLESIRSWFHILFLSAETKIQGNSKHFSKQANATFHHTCMISQQHLNALRVCMCSSFFSLCRSLLFLFLCVCVFVLFLRKERFGQVNYSLLFRVPTIQRKFGITPSHRSSSY